MATIHIDGKPYAVRPGQDLLSACLSLGIDLPYFCWHPALGSVGSCRQCAVKQFKDADDEQGKLVMACMTAADDGTRISVSDPEAEALRRGVIEWMMTNHPHDCPVCEEGGECHLQDMTVMSGHTYRRDRFAKRTFRNQDLGPLVGHEMNRCITCYRCVRFYDDYAGGNDLTALGIAHHVFFGREMDGALESPFSGNLVEVCPTGVFTDKPFSEHFIRKWDLMSTPGQRIVPCFVATNPVNQHRQVGVLGLGRGVLVWFEGSGARIGDAGLHGQVEPDCGRGPRSSVFEQICIAALDDPGFSARHERVEVRSGFVERAARRRCGGHPGQGVEIEMREASALGERFGQGRLARA